MAQFLLILKCYVKNLFLQDLIKKEPKVYQKKSHEKNNFVSVTPLFFIVNSTYYLENKYFNDIVLVPFLLTLNRFCT